MKKLYFLLPLVAILFLSLEGFAQINISNGSSTACSDTLYDSGGANGDYNHNESFHYSISPSGASLVRLYLDSVSLAPGDTIFIYDGADSTSSLLFAIDTTTVAPDSITTSGSSITVKFTSNAADSAWGFKMTWVGIYVPSVSISASSNAVCDGTSVTFSVTDSTNGGPDPSFQWKVNGVNSGTDLYQFTTTPVNADAVFVVMTSNATCGISSGVDSSNTETISTTTTDTASVSLTASDTNICNGTVVNFTATPTNGGTTPVYSWRVNGTPVGIDSAGYTDSTLSNGDFVVVTMASDIGTGCVVDSISSDSVEMVVTGILAASVSLSIDDPSVCSGDPQTFTASATNGGTTPTYSWRINGTPIGNTASTYIDSTLSDGDYVAVTMASDLVSNCLTDSITSDSIQVNINSNPSASISGSTDLLCPLVPTGSATGSATGGNGTYSYLWDDPSTQATATAINLLSGTYIVTITDDSSCTDTASIFIDQPTPFNISFSVTDASTFGGSDGAITATASGGTFIDNGGSSNDGYDHSWSNGANTTNPRYVHTINTLISGWYTDTITDDNNCLYFDSAFVDQPSFLSPGEIRISGTLSKAICNLDTVGAITETSAASGGVGTLTYTWQKSNNLLNWNDIPSSDSSDYLYNDTIISNTFIRRKVEDAASPSANVAFSNIIFLNYVPASVLSIIGLDNSYCTNDADEVLFGSPTGPGTGWFSDSPWMDSTSNTFTPATANANSSGLDNAIIYNYLDQYGCFNSTSDTSTIFSVATGSVSLPQSVYDTTDSAAVITSTYPLSGSNFSGTGVYKSGGVWYFDPKLADSVPQDIEILFTYDNPNGCTSYDTINVQIRTANLVLTTNLSKPSEMHTCYWDSIGEIFVEIPIGDTVTQYRWLIYDYINGRYYLEDSLVFTSGIFTDTVISTTFDPKNFQPVLTGYPYNQLAPTQPGVTTMAVYFQYYKGAQFTNLFRTDYELVNLTTAKIGPDIGNSNGLGAPPFQYCVNIDTVNFSSVVYPLGGRFPTRTYNLSPPTPQGISDQGNGNAYFFPDSAGAGSFDITFIYTDTITGCSIDTSTQLIVDALPIVTLTDLPDSNCANDGLIKFAGSPYAINKGTFFTPSSNLSLTHNNGSDTASITTTDLNVGNHLITYTYQATTGCINSDSINFVINPIPSLSIKRRSAQLSTDSLVHCFKDTAFYLKLINGMEDFSPSGLLYGSGFLTPSSDLFIADSAGIGSHFITYQSVDSNGCSNSTDTIIKVRALADATFIMADDTVCNYAGDSILMTSTFTGGINQVWEYHNDVSNGSTAYFKVAAGSIGNNTVTFKTDDGSIWGCSDSTQQIVRINNLLNISFTQNDDDFCVNQGTGTLKVNRPSLGASYFRSYTYSGSTKVYNNLLDSNALANSVDSIQFIPIDVDSTSNSEKVYVEYLHYDANSCLSIGTDSVFINDLPKLNITTTDDGKVCPTQSDSIELQGLFNGFVGALTGNFSGSIFGNAFVTNTNSAQSEGQYGPLSVDTALIDTVYYEYTDAKGCYNKTYRTFEIRKLAPASFTIDNTLNPSPKNICPDGIAHTTSFFDNCPTCPSYWTNITTNWYVDTSSSPSAATGTLLSGPAQFEPTQDPVKIGEWNYIIKKMTDQSASPGCASEYIDSVFVDPFPTPYAYVDSSFITASGKVCSNEGSMVIKVNPPSPGGSNASSVNSTNLYGGPWTSWLSGASQDSVIVYRDSMIAQSSSPFTKDLNFTYIYTEPTTNCTYDTTSTFTLKTAPSLSYVPPASTVFCPYDDSVNISLFVFNLKNYVDSGSAIITGAGINGPVIGGFQNYKPQIFLNDTFPTFDQIKWVQTDVDDCRDSVDITGFQVKNQPILLADTFSPGHVLCFDDKAIDLVPQYFDIDSLKFVNYATLTGPNAPNNKSFFTYQEADTNFTYQPFNGGQSKKFLAREDSKNNEDGTFTKVYFTGTYAGNNGCSNTSDTIVVTTRPKPVAHFYLDGLCSKYLPGMHGDSSTMDITGFPGDYISSYLWEINNDSAYVLNPGDTLVDYVYQSPLSVGKHDFYLTAVSKYGCTSDRLNEEFTFVQSPDADFTWYMSDECEGDTVTFLDRSTTPNGKANVTYNWIFGDGNFGSAKDSATNNYSDTGKYTVVLELIDGTDCRDSSIRDIYIRPIFSPNLNKFKYLDDFEKSYSGWVVWEQNYDKLLDDTIVANPNKEKPSWFKWGQRTVGNITTDAAHNNGWYLDYSVDTTGSQYYYQNLMQTSVIGPCFDMTNTERPMITLESIYSLDENDGVTVQFTTDVDKPLDQVTWVNVGEYYRDQNTQVHYPTGIEWYSKDNIFGNPGLQTDVQRKIGWTENQLDWKESRHNVDNALGEDYVRFRIAFGSNAEVKGEGYIFDNFGISERKKNVVFEAFTNTSSNQSAINMKTYDDDVVAKSPDVLDIQYHTSFPGKDPLNNDNTVDPSARSVFYGVSEVSYVHSDGNNYSNYVSSQSFGRFTPMPRALEDPKFEVEMIFNPSTDMLETKIIALDEEYLTKPVNVTVQIALLEKEIDGGQFTFPSSSSNWVNYQFKNTLKRLYPSAAGTTFNNMFKGDVKNISTEILYENFYGSTDGFKIVAFVQDKQTKEIYQANWVDIDNPQTVGEPEYNDVLTDALDYNLYPNPTNGMTNMEFEQDLDQNYQLIIYDQLGAVVFQEVIAAGTRRHSFDLNGLRAGMYFVMLNDGSHEVAIKKLMLTQ